MQARGLANKVSALVDEAVASLRPVSGGDINQAFAVTLASGRTLFAKTHTSALPEVFQLEAQGLGWLASARALRVPEVIAASDSDEQGPACLLLEYVAPASGARRTAGFDEELGRGLAALHRSGAPSFGLMRANYLATLTQDNTPQPSWAEFYARQRLEPLLARAKSRGLLPSALVGRMQRLFERMPLLVGDPEPPARLHGDLWSGNVLAAESGEPYLIDPAVYGGHREIDLAMMHLFGGFSKRVFDAYQEAFPLAPGHTERIALHQLYPLLAHVNLFGSSYVEQLDHALRQYV